MPQKIAAFTPYFTEEKAGQVRAAFLAAGHLEGDASVSDFIVRATMQEVNSASRGLMPAGRLPPRYRLEPAPGRAAGTGRPFPD